MVLVLHEIGFLAESVSTAAEARGRLASSASYALVVIEAALPGEEPGESGYALISWYHGALQSGLHPVDPCGRPPAAFISVTAKPDVDAAERFGFLACVAKPITSDSFLHVLHKLVRIRIASV